MRGGCPNSSCIITKSVLKYDKICINAKNWDICKILTGAEKTKTLLVDNTEGNLVNVVANLLHYRIRFSRLGHISFAGLCLLFVKLYIHVHHAHQERRRFSLGGFGTQ